MTNIDRAVVRLVHAQRHRLFGRGITMLLQLLGVHFPAAVKVGTDLVLPHSTAGLVLHYTTVIGDRVTIFHGVTIGRADGAAPSREEIPGCVVGDDCVICAGAVILPGMAEPLTIGPGAVIGANAVVTRSVPAGEVWVGNPAHLIG